MGRDDEPGEVLDLGVVEDAPDPAATPPAGPGSRLSRRGLVTAGGLVVVAGALAVVSARGSSTPARPPTPSRSASAGPSPAGTPRPSPSPRPAVADTELGHPLLGATGAWDLFALGQGVVLRIRPASGRITRTALPPLGDTDISLVPARGRLLIHPTDYRQGYLVPDGRPVVELPVGLDGAGPMLPGPDADHVWMQVQEAGHAVMSLVGLEGRATGVRVAVPAYAAPPLPDGRGNLLFEGIGGVYLGDTRGLRRLTQGALIAVGSSGWLTLDCDDRALCSTVLLSRDGGRRTVPAAIAPQYPHGVLSPDGRMAALFIDPGTSGDPGRMGLGLLDLMTGARHTVDVALSPTGGAGTLVWSPDSRWLLAVGETGELTVVDPRRRTESPLAPGLPLVFELAVRA
ncbi:MAG: hypothetical protein ACXV3S_01090 [Kineosporiaceae bacterium]